MKRIRAVEAGEQIPRDILSSILQVACEYSKLMLILTDHFVLFHIATKESVDIEDLVDDFVTFYVAGNRLYTKCVCSIAACMHALYTQGKRLLETCCLLQ